MVAAVFAAPAWAAEQQVPVVDGAAGVDGDARGSAATAGEAAGTGDRFGQLIREVLADAEVRTGRLSDVPGDWLTSHADRFVFTDAPWLLSVAGRVQLAVPQVSAPTTEHVDDRAAFGPQAMPWPRIEPVTRVVVGEPWTSFGPSGLVAAEAGGQTGGAVDLAAAADPQGLAAAGALGMLPSASVFAAPLRGALLTGRAVVEPPTLDRLGLPERRPTPAVWTVDLSLFHQAPRRPWSVGASLRGRRHVDTTFGFAAARPADDVRLVLEARRVLIARRLDLVGRYEHPVNGAVRPADRAWYEGDYGLEPVGGAEASSRFTLAAQYHFATQPARATLGLGYTSDPPGDDAFAPADAAPVIDDGEQWSLQAGLRFEF
jgi:hypothetical protein